MIEEFVSDKSSSTLLFVGAKVPRALTSAAAVAAMTVTLICSSSAQEPKIARSDTLIDGLDVGIKIFVREKMAEGNTRFGNDNIILFLHGATSPSTCDFDLSYQDYSWADLLAKRGYVIYMGDYRDYGGSTREKAMDEPAARTSPSHARTWRFATFRR